MCGRYTGFDAEQEKEIIEIIKAVERKTKVDNAPVSFKTSGEVFPTDYAPVLLDDYGNLTSAVMQWGYPGYPDRNNPRHKPRPLINAKSETAAQLQTWRDSLIARRCIIPSCGFYEWQHGGKNDKAKYIFNLPGEDALYMAGIYKTFPIPDSSDVMRFAILTATANDSMREVHSRMPVVLRKSEFNEWLYGDYAQLFDRQAILLDKQIA